MELKFQISNMVHCFPSLRSSFQRSFRSSSALQERPSSDRAFNFTSLATGSAEGNIVPPSGNTFFFLVFFSVSSKNTPGHDKLVYTLGSSGTCWCVLLSPPFLSPSAPANRTEINYTSYRESILPAFGDRLFGEPNEKKTIPGHPAAIILDVLMPLFSNFQWDWLSSAIEQKQKEGVSGLCRTSWARACIISGPFFHEILHNLPRPCPKNLGWLCLIRCPMVVRKENPPQHD